MLKLEMRIVCGRALTAGSAKASEMGRMNKVVAAIALAAAAAMAAFLIARICGGTCPLRGLTGGNGAGDGAAGASGDATGPVVQVRKFVTVAWEAEEADEIEPPMRKVEAKLGNLIGGSGYLEIPDKSNPYEVDGKVETIGDCAPPCGVGEKGGGKRSDPRSYDQPKFPGRAVYNVEVPEDGEYFFWIRTWWLDSCGDSVFYKVDDGPYRVLAGDPTTRASAGRDVWRWRTELSAGKPRTFKLAKGLHRIEIRNREDGPRFDQLMLTTDPSHPGDEVVRTARVK